jgi:predicted DNA-binding transcriptional regulator AlpA
MTRIATEIAPRGLSRIQAASYLGIGTTLFDELVSAGTMPPPRRIKGRVVWDRFELDVSFEALPSDSKPTEPDKWAFMDE